jgi:hypothetical protein
VTVVRAIASEIRTSVAAPAPRLRARGVPGAALALPLRFVRNLVELREKRPPRFGALFMVVCFVAFTRGELEILLARTPGMNAPSAVNNVAFYLQSMYLYGWVAVWLTGRPLRKVLGVVAVGVFLGVFPPIVDALLGGVGSGYYRYVSALSAFRPSLINPDHYSTGEAVVLWAVIVVLAIYVAEVTRSFARTALALVAGYAVVAFISAGPSSIVTALFSGRTPFQSGFKLPFLTLLQLGIAQTAYLACRPALARRLAKRLLHALPFVALVFLGSAVSELFAPTGLPPAERFKFAGFAALAILELCVVALVHNDAFDAAEDRGRELPGASAAVDHEDAHFFTAVGVLGVLALGLASGALGAPLALFLIASMVYSFDFYRGKRYFPTNYKCEGIWGASAFVLGGSASYVVTPTRTPSAAFVLAALLVFGGFSLFNAFKDYKDIRADYHAGNQTAYVLALKYHLRLRSLHRALRCAFALALVLPPLLLARAGVALLPLCAFALPAAALLVGVLGGAPNGVTVRRFLWGTALYIGGLALVVELCALA